MSTVSGIVVEPMTAAHWDGVRCVYLEGIATGNATFETEAPSWEARSQRPESTEARAFPILLREDRGELHVLEQRLHPGGVIEASAV